VKIHLIAEAGTNHNGSVETGRRLIAAAAAAGADSVKFQMIFPDGLYLPRLYENGRYRESEVYAARCATALTPDQFRELADACREADLPFSASVFDRTGAALLDELDAPYIKVASCDLNNSPLLRAAADTGRLILLSTGMSTLAEIERAVRDVQAAGNRRLVLMHCVSVYPCPTGLMNLGFLDTLRSQFGLPVGLSDHTESSLAAAIAVAKGVSWIEKHMTLDRSLPGFDHAYAMEPESLAAFVADVRTAAEACAPQPAKVSPQEQQVRARARRGLYAARDITVGETITEADVLIVRPEGPLPPNALPAVCGRVTTRPIRQYEALTWEALTRHVETELESRVTGEVSRNSTHNSELETRTLSVGCGS